MTVLGFTGSRWGLSAPQLVTLAGVMTEGWDAVHHGDCVGADAQCHAMAKACGLWVVVHPPTDQRLRAFCAGDETRAVAPYHVRDQAIVDAADVLVACPREGVPVPRSGTWLTIRLGRNARIPVRVVFPDGSFAPTNVAAG